MKNKLLVIRPKQRFSLLVFLLLCTSSVFAVSNIYETARTVIGSVSACGPVTVYAQKIQHSSLGGSIGPEYSYSVSTGDGWNLRVRINSARDCNGNSCSVHCDKHTKTTEYPHGVKINNSIYYKVIEHTWTYTIRSGGSSVTSSTSSSSGNGGSNGSYGGGSSSTSSRASELGAAMGHAAMAIQAQERLYEHYHAGGFSLSATVSAAWGENLEMRFRYGSSRLGGDVTGMVGYDWINGKPGDRVTWNVGLGMYFGGRPSYLYLWDVGFGVKFGKSNIPYNDAFTVMIDSSTTHLIGPQHVVGLTAGAGIGLGGNGKSPDFAWDVRAGIVVYFLQWNWF
jgi:hypothetical protein